MVGALFSLAKKADLKMNCILSQLLAMTLMSSRFMADCEVAPVRIWRKGDPNFPKSRPDGKKNHNSGANFEVSPADFSRLDLQIDDAQVFFEDNSEFIRRLRSFPGVEGLDLDFGADIHPPGFSWFTFPPELFP